MLLPTLDLIESSTAKMILGYLSDNPEAEDTIEGIVEWWLLKEEVKRRTADVKNALVDLVERGLVLERQGSDQRRRYLLNSAKRRDVDEFLRGS